MTAMLGVSRGRVVVWLVFLLGAVALLGACSGTEDAPAEGSEATSIEAAASANQPNADGIPVKGSLVFPNRAALSFDAAGVVGEVFVVEGQRVQAGQALVSLDARRTAELERARSQAQASVTSAEAALNALKISAPTLTAQAELQVATAEVELQEAQQALEDIIEEPNTMVVSAQLAAAQSAVNLDRAQEALDELLEPKDLLVSAAEQRVAAARVEVDAAQETYDDIKDGSFPDNIVRDARNRTAFAATTLDIANDSLSDAELGWENTLKQAQDAHDLLLQQYIGLFDYWFGTEPTEAELLMKPADMFTEWGIDLDATFDHRNPLYWGVRPTPDDPDTRWNEITIWAWLNLYPQYGFVVPTCDLSRQLASRERCVEREFDDMFDALDGARDALAAAQNGAAAATESARDAVAAAEAALIDAQDDLEDVEDGPDASVVEAAEKRLNLAKVSLIEAEEDLAELTVDIDPLEIAQAEASLAFAKTGLRQANVELERAMDNGMYVEHARRRLDLATAVLDEAVLQLADSQKTLQEQLSVADANVKLAQEALAEAEEEFVGAVLHAPFDGVVSLVNVQSDDAVDDELTAVEVTAADVVEVDGVIDAAGRPFVTEGSSAVVSIASIGDTRLAGEVTFIGNEVRTERGLVSYAVRIRAQVPPNVEIPIRLSAASATITPESAPAPTALRTYSSERPDLLA